MRRPAAARHGGICRVEQVRKVASAHLHLVAVDIVVAEDDTWRARRETQRSAGRALDRGTARLRRRRARSTPSRHSSSRRRCERPDRAPAAGPLLDHGVAPRRVRAHPPARRRERSRDPRPIQRPVRPPFARAGRPRSSPRPRTSRPPARETGRALPARPRCPSSKTRRTCSSSNDHAVRELCLSKASLGRRPRGARLREKRQIPTFAGADAEALAAFRGRHRGEDDLFVAKAERGARGRQALPRQRLARRAGTDGCGR